MENIKSQKLQRVKNGEKKIKVSLREGIGAAVFLILGIVFGQGSVFDELYPFGFAFVIASNGVYSFFALLGTSIGLVFSQTGVYLFRYIVCAAALWLIRSRILSSRSRLGEIWFLSVLTCFLVCTLTGIAVVLPTRGGFDEIVLFVAEGIIAAFSAFFYRRCISAVMKIREKPFEKKEMPCFCIAFATLVASLGAIEISGFYPALFVAFCITHCSYSSFMEINGYCSLLHQCRGNCAELLCSFIIIVYHFIFHYARLKCNDYYSSGNCYY